MCSFAECLVAGRPPFSEASRISKTCRYLWRSAGARQLAVAPDGADVRVDDRLSSLISFVAVFAPGCHRVLQRVMQNDAAVFRTGETLQEGCQKIDDTVASFADVKVS